MGRVQRVLTSLVGSYPQPDWLLDREKLRGRQPPRIRAADFWRVAEDASAGGAGRGHPRRDPRPGAGRAGHRHGRRDPARELLQPCRDGARRGWTSSNPGSTLDRNGNPFPVPRIVGTIERPNPILLRDAEFLRANTERAIKVTIPGPFTMAQQAQNDYYAGERDVAYAFADVVRAEIEDLFAAGVDVVQLDEPWMESRADAAREYGIDTLQRALDGVTRHDRPAHLLRLPAVRARPQARVPLPGRAGRRARSTRSRSSPRRPSSTSRSWRRSKARRSSSA